MPDREWHGIVRNAEQWTGHVFNRLTVLSASRIGTRTMWECKCTCGKTVVVRASHVRRGATQSCGCLHDEGRSNPKHGMSASPEYRAWRGMISRCTCPSATQRRIYKGIKVCDRWLHSFENFYADMGERPSPGHSVDRKDTHGDYEPGNCRWATASEQQRNKRNNVYVELDGERRLVCELVEQYAAEAKVSKWAFAARLERGWSLEQALCTPPQTRS